MSVIDQEATELYRERAIESHAATLAAWEQEFGPLATADAAGPDEYVAFGTATFSTAFIWGIVVVQLTFVDGTRMEFNGQHWGLGLGGGISAGSAIFTVPTASLIGDGTYSVATMSGVLNIVFYKNHIPVGTFNGPALSVGPAVVGGSGTWTRK
jgi:hypothetical protein